MHASLSVTRRNSILLLPRAANILLGLVPRVSVLDVYGKIDQQRVWQRPLHKILDDGLRFSY